MIETKTIKIANYHALELIHESSRTEVYRGHNVENGQSVIIKLMRNQYPSFRELVQFRNQYVISKNLEIEGIIKTYTLERYENRYALILEDMGGVSLAEYQGKASLCLSQFLNIAIQLSEILHQLHNNSIIHKDIKPANILIHPETKQVKLIDFSISTLLPKETQAVQTPNFLEGTLAYLSPEQTGRMNRAVDYRSDFYSLGVTFYELLMGDVPFRSDDALELIHAHLALSPEPLSNSVVLGGSLCPPSLSDIVLKLMAKNAEERYQSALGLKYDLEKCLSQYQESGKIEAFELGQRDRSDRFVIPEKLYGRENEVQVLLDAFEGVAEGKSEMMLVAGFSGIGKTAVVNEVHKPIVKQRGYFVKGKFDQFNRNIPFSAFVQAFRSLMGQIFSESDTELDNWKTKIREALGNNGQVLVDVIPELEQVIGQQPPAPGLSGSAAQNRFNLLFQKFIAVFTTTEHPLVMFLDDLQWADSASLNLMKVLIGDNETGYLLLLGAYRDNEVFPAHPLMLTLADLEKQQAAISTITLAPLSTHHINQLVAETLSCQAEQAQPLTELVYQKTQGNPFFTTQFLKGLYEDELIVFNPNLGFWECDLVKVQDAALIDDVVEFMASRLQKLPAATQEVLKLAACIGNQFDLETLAVVCLTPSEEVASELWNALQEGAVIPISEAYKFFQGEIDSNSTETVTVNYRFLHDRVQQAAYSLIPEARKQETHLKIGRSLQKETSEVDWEEKIFGITNHLNRGRSLIVNPDERQKLSQLNLQAGCKAKAATAYESALEYLLLGIDLLEADCWTSQYDLTLALYESATESFYLDGDLQKMEEFADIGLKNAQDLLDTIAIYEIIIQALQAQLKFQEAIDTAMIILEKLEIRSFPENPESFHVELWLDEVRKNLRGRAPSTLVNLPTATEPRAIAAIRILASICSAAYKAAPMLMPLITFEQVNLSIKYGNSSVSAFAYADQGLVLCGMCNDIEVGYQFGELASKLLRKSDKVYAARTFHIINAHVKHNKEHLRTTFEGLKTAYSVGLETGDLEFAGYGALYYSLYSYLCGQELSELEQEITAYSHGVERIKQATSKNYIEIYRQAVQNLLGCSQNPCLLVGKAYDEDKMLPIHQEANDLTALYYLNFNRGLLCYLFQEYDHASRSLAVAQKYLGGAIATPLVPLFHFYQSLVMLIQFDWQTEIKRQTILKQITANQAILNDFASYVPANYLHKWCLVEAEKHRVLSNKLEAIELYDRAISGAKETKYIQEEALSNELFAKFYLDWGKEKYAVIHMQEAYYCYAQWGAKAKTNDLEERYPELLKPILQRDIATTNRVSSTSSTSISQITSNSYSQTATVANISSILDFSSLLKASQTLSGEIELERLLSTVMKIIIENAGATKGALLLTSETGLTIEAIANRTEDSSKLTIDSLNQSIPLEDTIDLPVGLINYVRRTTETVLLDAKAALEQFAADRYLLRFHPQSLLCIPLLERGKLIGILYLENSLTADVFTSDRVEILDSLCAQAAISIENARLYQQAQQALKDLQEAQLQLVQSEKMATLGNLVAGVAHEINNPVGFIGGNISTAQEYVQDLLQALSLYQENTSPSESMITALEDLDIDFIAEDFPKMIASMQAGCDRICNISKSLRTFSRTDTAAKTEFNLHDGIDSTLLILKYRLKANENRPAIEVVRNYGNMTPVKCYAGQLNQVFMNLLANAIDALEESNPGKTFQEIEKEPNRITIETKLSNSDHSVIVRISDNGVGMPEEVKAKIFQQGFTTKGVGKGTGLGMAIAQSIVEEKHGGAISCHSELGKGTEFMIELPIG
ncbi:ATP-binding sensor histidine kinase [Okeania sp. SIO2B3]|uniref:trifunctional serine/threonine-protein kinase/ATP-binding protein/sensor histidine kinase n=1 Tax=Okeania sp. SIO2B3 TaxID=2607784 RepID=UPI0013C1C821|nr:ATP-binding sensor histidine kinase [Okeania sp. SIO2B3]NET42801.1 AAA family ATPase [Okeania sp. SIO2B3]